MVVINKNQFWEIIDKAACLKQDKKYERLSNELSLYSAEDICRFHLFLGTYVSCAESPASWFLCKLITGYASDDSELYFRLWLVSLGKDRFLGSLKNPDYILEKGLPEGEHNFEELMVLSYDVLCKKVDDVDSLWGKYFITDEEEAQIRTEVDIAHFDWFEDSEELLSQAKICAPKLYAYFKKGQEHSKLKRQHDTSGS